MQHYLKKIFATNFTFLTDSPRPPPHPHPLNSQNLLSVTKVLLSVFPEMSFEFFLKIIGRQNPAQASFMYQQ